MNPHVLIILPEIPWRLLLCFIVCVQPPPLAVAAEGNLAQQGLSSPFWRNPSHPLAVVVDLTSGSLPRGLAPERFVYPYCFSKIMPGYIYAIYLYFFANARQENNNMYDISCTLSLKIQTKESATALIKSIRRSFVALTMTFLNTKKPVRVTDGLSLLRAGARLQSSCGRFTTILTSQLLCDIWKLLLPWNAMRLFQKLNPPPWARRHTPGRVTTL